MVSRAYVYSEVLTMLFMLPSLLILGIYFLAAVLPAWFLLKYIYKEDTIEKEPPLLLISLVGLGVVAALAAGALEYLGARVLSLFLDQRSPAYVIVFSFLVIAAAEEGAKLFFLKRRTWNDPNFNYRFDGIVYAVYVSLGFAAFENIKYVMGYGLSVAVPRALLAIPGHMSFAVFMGVFYGRAKLCANQGNKTGERINLLAGYISAVLLHGFYDACALIGNVLATVLFVAFVSLMYLTVFRLIKKSSANDAPI